ncbi:hypothetical protein ACSV5S_11105 [Agrobacterium deltaense]|uniref:hypothetical protein n=1 Tax=Agrobacterium deltaense TaxID=1183412 RepID=UPI003FD24968
MHSLHNIFPNVGPLPADWKALALLIETATGPGTAVLSGGALRDWGHGAPVKDLDFFVPWSVDNLCDLNDLMELNGWSKVQNIPPSCEGLGEVVAVVGYSKPGMLDLNVIFLSEDHDLAPSAVARRNDFGICQIAAWIELDGEWRFDYSSAFIEDVMAKTFTLLREGDEARSLRRYERLKEKYPDHTLVTPNITPTTNLLPI